MYELGIGQPTLFNWVPPTHKDIINYLNVINLQNNIATSTPKGYSILGQIVYCNICDLIQIIRGLLLMRWTELKDSFIYIQDTNHTQGILFNNVAMDQGTYFFIILIV